jgi:hypothetical protein
MLVRIRLDFIIAVDDDVLPAPNIYDLLEPGVRATIPKATAIEPQARAQISRVERRPTKRKRVTMSDDNHQPQ